LIVIRRPCRYCPKPEACYSLGYCPTRTYECGDNRMYSIREAVEVLKNDLGIKVSENLIKYYHQKGLIDPAKTVGGHRRFDDKCLEEILFIKRILKKGYKIDEIGYFKKIVDSKDIRYIRDLFGKIVLSYEDDYIQTHNTKFYFGNRSNSFTDIEEWNRTLERLGKRIFDYRLFGYILKNYKYNKDENRLKFDSYLFPDKTIKNQKNILKFLDFHDYYIISKNFNYDISNMTKGYRKFTLAVDDRYTKSNKIIKMVKYTNFNYKGKPYKLRFEYLPQNSKIGKYYDYFSFGSELKSEKIEEAGSVVTYIYL
jgi:DNA-binding transcriptional MerR regulator